MYVLRPKYLFLKPQNIPRQNNFEHFVSDSILNIIFQDKRQNSLHFLKDSIAILSLQLIKLNDRNYHSIKVRNTF